MTNLQLMTIPEVAAYLRVDRSTVWRWCVAGKLPAFKAGRSWRIHRSVIEQIVEAGLPPEDMGASGPGEEE